MCAESTMSDELRPLAALPTAQPLVYFPRSEERLPRALRAAGRMVRRSLPALASLAFHGGIALAAISTARYVSVLYDPQHTVFTLDPDGIKVPVDDDPRAPELELFDVDRLMENRPGPPICTAPNSSGDYVGVLPPRCEPPQLPMADDPPSPTFGVDADWWCGPRSPGVGIVKAASHRFPATRPADDAYRLPPRKPATVPADF